jgi:signal transduction histidine kinase
MEEVRYRNGLTLAWIRVGLRTVTLALWLFWLPRLSLHEQALNRPIILVNILHLAIGGWVLLALLRRRHVHMVLAIAAATDLLVVAFAGWNSEPGDSASAGFLMGVMQLMLLFSGLTLPRYQATAVGAIATAWELYLGLRLGLHGDLVAAMVLVTGTFAIAITWASTRMMDLAARRASGDYTGQLVRAHRDALARANLQIANQRDQVLAAQAEAETLSKLVVHDLKNPLAALQQFVWTARGRLREPNAVPSPEDLAEAREDLDFALEEVKRLAGMIGDLLLISRLESTALKPHPQSVPVRALLDQVANGMRLLGADRRVSVLVTAPPDLMASLDLELARRLLENLGSNALRFVNSGGTVELIAEVTNGTLVLGVNNTGPEVPRELRSQLFQKHSSGTGQTIHNLGLGLYLCRLVAEAHGGIMVLGERPNWSASFEARLPH